MKKNPGVDTGYPRGRHQPQRGSQPTIQPNFPNKLQENEENWTQGGGARPKFYYADPPLIWSVNSKTGVDTY